MALLYEVERFTKLSGEDGKHTSIERIGAFLDGYATALGDIDAEPVIRCKDCKYMGEVSLTHNGDYIVNSCGYHNSFVNKNDYCSRAERRTDGTD